jgi:hypothetical protein
MFYYNNGLMYDGEYKNNIKNGYGKFYKNNNLLY